MQTVASTTRAVAVGPEGAGVPAGKRSRLLGLSWAHLLNDGAANYLPECCPRCWSPCTNQSVWRGADSGAHYRPGPPAGDWLADRLVGRALTVSGLTVSSLGGCLFGVAHSTWLLVVLLLLVDIGNAFFHPQALAALRSVVHGRQGLFTSAFLVGGELGRGIWPTGASLVVAHLGLDYLWQVGLPGLATAPFLAQLTPRLPTRTRQRQPIHSRPMALLIAYQSIRALILYATFIPIL